MIINSNALEQASDVIIRPHTIAITAEAANSVSQSQLEIADESVMAYDVKESVSSEKCFSKGFNSNFKAYMDYRTITDTSSVQYSLQQQAYTDERGFRRIGEDYCVALGTGITDGCGERFIIHLDSGYSFTAIVSDIKADIHTDSTNCFAPRGNNAGNIVEFIIDSDNAERCLLTSGTASCFTDLNGNVTSIEKI